MIDGLNKIKIDSDNTMI